MSFSVNETLPAVLPITTGNRTDGRRKLDYFLVRELLKVEPVMTMSGRKLLLPIPSPVGALLSASLMSCVCVASYSEDDPSSSDYSKEMMLATG